MAEVILARLDDVTLQTVENTGTVGVGVFKQMSGTAAQFYKLNAASAKLTIALNGTDRIDFDLGVVPASAITFTPTGAIAATNVQTAIAELDTEKAAAVHTHSSADVTDFTEAAQDAVGAMVGNTATINLTYADVTPSLTAAVNDGSITYAKMQDISAQFRLLGRNSASAGDAEEVTLTQLLDWIGSAAQGDILYRGAASWARLGAGTSGQFLQTQGAGADPQWAASSGGTPGYGLAMTNGKLSVTVAASALTVALKTLAGADPSAGDPVKIRIPDGSGGYNVRTITGALSFTVSSGSTMGFGGNSVAGRIWWGALDNAGTVELFGVNCKTNVGINAPLESETVTTTAEGGAGGADTAGTPYSTTARASVQFAWLGFSDFDSGQATNGTWASAPTATVLKGPGVALPGAVVKRQTIFKTDTFSQATAVNTWYAITGLSIAYTMGSPCNMMLMYGQVTIGASNNETASLRLKSDASVLAPIGDTAGSRLRGHTAWNLAAAANNVYTVPFRTTVFYPASATYSVDIGGVVNATTVYVNRGQTDTDSTTYTRYASFLELEEIMG